MAQDLNLKNVETILKEKGITPTSTRILVFRCLLESKVPLSLSEIEKFLNTVDKSSIFRTLNLFKEKGIVHFFQDFSGFTRYELCNTNHEEKNDFHIHFQCIKCGETTCLPFLKVPEINLPEGYRIQNINFIISGICNKH